MPEKVKEYFEKGPRTIEKVIANEDYTLTVHFDNGEVRIYDMSEMLYGVFEVLKDKAKFKKVFLDEYGNIAWDMMPMLTLTSIGATGLTYARILYIWHLSQLVNRTGAGRGHICIKTAYPCLILY